EGDTIEVSFDMDIRQVVSHPKVGANTGKIAFERGPLVYCAEQVDNPDGVLNLNLPKQNKLNYTFDQNLLHGIGKITAEYNTELGSNTLTVIPYFAWAHREIGEMAVWIDSK